MTEKLCGELPTQKTTGLRKAQTNELQWREWLSTNAELLRRAGLPLVVLKNEDHWLDFVENGDVYYHDYPSEFGIGQMTLHQKSAFMRLLLTRPRLLSTLIAQQIALDMVQAVEGQYGIEE